jgi:hypothetical protein
MAGRNHYYSCAAVRYQTMLDVHCYLLRCYLFPQYLYVVCMSLPVHMNACTLQAKADLGYKPLWSIQDGLHLTVRSFSNLRNPHAATPPTNSTAEVTLSDLGSHSIH